MEDELSHLGEPFSALAWTAQPDERVAPANQGRSGFAGRAPGNLAETRGA
jgi:hypothetical protein